MGELAAKYAGEKIKEAGFILCPLPNVSFPEPIPQTDNVGNTYFWHNDPDHHRMFYTLEGRADIHSRDQAAQANGPGNLSIIPAGREVQFRILEDWTYILGMKAVNGAEHS